VKGSLSGGPLPPVGAPNLTDNIWLYGGDPAMVRESIARGRSGQMPAWSGEAKAVGKKLTPLQIKQVTLYVHGLGGGQ
ncbi:MAG: hypothetical protein H7838_03110, partial [Magnetococcus sp. DMHC-8]